MITIIILSLLTLGILIWWMIARRRQRLARSRDDEIPLFAVPASAPGLLARPFAAPARSGRAAGPSRSATSDTPSGEHMALDPDRFAPAAPVIRTRDGAVSTLARPPRDSRDPGEPNDAVGLPVDGESVRYWRPADGTLQFLPGRLEVVAGHDAGQEIRFVRTAGPDGTSVTFGRAEGAPYRHVQLRAPTVSRAHARMVLAHSGDSLTETTLTTSSLVNGQHWHLENLSTTNPVVVNGRPLQPGGAPGSSVVLADGDRIEMGEVAFVFHSR